MCGVLVGGFCEVRIKREKSVVVLKVGNIFVIGQFACILRRIAYDIANVVDVFMERQRLGKFRVGNNGGIVLFVVFFKQPFGGVQVREFNLEISFPNLFDSGIGFGNKIRPVKVTLGVFMHKRTFDQVT